MVDQMPHPPPNLLITLCTIGISLPLTLYTTISPTCVSCPLFHKKSKSPRWNAGSMLPDRTTTMGEEEFVKTERPFHSMKAVERTRAKLRTWAASWRGCRFDIEPNIVAYFPIDTQCVLREAILDCFLPQHQCCCSVKR